MTGLSLSKKDQLLKFCSQLVVFNSVMVREWGLRNQYISADRVVRKFAEDGIIRRIPTEEAMLRGYVKKGRAAIAWYEIKSDQN